jgi:hypothetical protein
VVVATGVTVCVPPLPSITYELPSLPETVTDVESTALTVNVDELPEVIEDGVAVIVTVGAGLAVTVTVT